MSRAPSPAEVIARLRAKFKRVHYTKIWRHEIAPVLDAAERVVAAEAGGELFKTLLANAERRAAIAEKKVATILEYHRRAIPEGDPNYPCPGEHRDGECLVCSIIDCAYAEPFHYHHDGCPAEWAMERELTERAERAEANVRRLASALYLGGCGRDPKCYRCWRCESEDRLLVAEAERETDGPHHQGGSHA